jgi:hypothetical protein
MAQEHAVKGIMLLLQAMLSINTIAGGAPHDIAGNHAAAQGNSINMSDALDVIAGYFLDPSVDMD